MFHYVEKANLNNVQTLLPVYLMRVATTPVKHTEVSNTAAHDNFKTSDRSPDG